MIGKKRRVIVIVTSWACNRTCTNYIQAKTMKEASYLILTPSAVPLYVEVNATVLVPPSFTASTEVILNPGREDNLVVFCNITVCKSEGKRGGSTNDSSSGGVLWSVTRAHELVVSCRPWHDASQVGAHYIINKSKYKCEKWMNDLHTFYVYQRTQIPGSFAYQR